MKFEVGDKVRLADSPQPDTSDLEWEPEMNELCGKVGVITEIDEGGYCYVKIPAKRLHWWWFSPEWLTKVSPSSSANNKSSNKLLLLWKLEI